MSLGQAWNQAMAGGKYSHVDRNDICIDSYTGTSKEEAFEVLVSEI